MTPATPIDVAALAQARERLDEARVVHAMSGSTALYIHSDVRLVLDALREEERHHTVVDATLAYWKRSDHTNWAALAIAIHAVLRERGEQVGATPKDRVGEIVANLRGVLAGCNPPPFRWNVFVEQSDLIALLDEIEGARFARGLKSGDAAKEQS